MRDEISDNVLNKRIEKNWSQQELAKRSGVAQSIVSRVEAGGGMNIETLRSLAEAFGCAVVDLLPERDKRRPG